MQKQVLPGTETRCSVLANTNVSTRTALHTCWAAAYCSFSYNYSLYLRIQQNNNCHHGSVMFNSNMFMCKKFIYIHTDRQHIRQYGHEYEPVDADRLQRPLAIKYQTKWKLCWTPYCKFQECYNYNQNYTKRDFFTLKELKRADIREDNIISLDDNHGAYRRKTQKDTNVQVWRFTTWELPPSIPSLSYKSPTNSNCQNFASQVKPLPLYSCKKQGQKTSKVADITQAIREESFPQAMTL